MPAKKVITREKIIDGAIRFIEERGGASLNARELAKFLCCSTQPIYLSFSSMDELKNVLIEECLKIYYTYIEKSSESESTVFGKFMFAYVSFAFEKPKLFEYVYMINKYRDTDSDRKFTDDIVKAIMNVGGYDYKTAYKFYIQSWIHAHGIAVQLITGYVQWTLPEIRSLMLEEFEALKILYQKEK